LNIFFSDKNITCTFETDLCSWEFQSTAPDDIFIWSRLRGIDLTNQGLHGPSVDHLENSEGYFIYVGSKLDMPEDPDPFKTYFTSPYFVGSDHPIECISFWFSIEVCLNLKLFLLMTTKLLEHSFSTIRKDICKKQI
jgi:hypothetical protein